MTGRNALGGKQNQKPIMKETALTLGKWHPASGLGVKWGRESLCANVKDAHPNPEDAVRLWHVCKLLVLLPTLSDKPGPEPAPPHTNSTLLPSDWVQPEAALSEASLSPAGG